jgi:hypothetical protein
VGARAIIDIDDDTGGHARFWSGWASPHYQIPHLARFVHDTDATGEALTLAAYRAWAAGHPDTLPIVVLDVPAGGRTAALPDDLDYRYRLRLSTRPSGAHYTVAERSRRRRTPRWHTTHTLSSRGQLFRAAADMCEALARNTERYAGRNDGTGLPGFPSAEQWRTEAAVFTAWYEATDRPAPGTTTAAGPPPLG